MVKMDEVDKLAYLRMLSHYLKMYQDEYPEEVVEHIKGHFLERMPISDTVDILKQIYALFGMLKPEENCYLGFSKMIGEKYGWDYHVLEIGSGFYPIFSKYMDDSQKENKSSGTITTYDPLLIVNKLGSIKLHKEEFKKETDISSYDLLVGIMPCDATSTIIRRAIKEHKEFFVAMCGCIHYKGIDVPRGTFGPIPISYDTYVDKIYSLAQEQQKDGFEVTKEDAWQYSFRYPVISSKRK